MVRLAYLLFACLLVSFTFFRTDPAVKPHSNPAVRRLSVLVAALLALSFSAACSSDSSSSADDTSGPWSFVDGSGETVQVDHTPKRIIAHAYAAAALMSFGIKPIAVWADSDVTTDPGTKDLDLSGVEILGETFGEIDVEKAASLRPDLIVGDWWPVENAHSGFEAGVKEESKKLADLAPVVGPSQGDSIVELIEGYEKLAASLGGKLDDPTVAANKQRFETARSNFTQATAAKPGLTALAVSPTTDGLAVAVPKYAPELLDFQSWGLNVVDPERPDEGFPYWETLSWENADRYQPDLLLIDDRSYPANLDDAKKQPSWTSVAAAKADSVVPWPAYWLHTYSDYATQLEQLTKAVQSANADLVG